uniref:TSA: Wollemia nobilis Ref_Wollemi_Transcript_970_676 transcribed RNA sequence n=1 Tax=Wollemia nobilis TaxID=56998 RepID=A0A0C9S9E9_9CONI
MGFTQIDAKVDNFSAALTSVEANNDKDRITLLLFLADKDPSSGLSWCPGDRPTWRNPSHPWRMDERFKLKGLPTLIRWKEGAIAGRLEDHEAHIESRISKLLD